ncbi:MAG TPA: DUF167 domain-containing protein [Polyangiaceae bacterium]|nr:DUF167 domain-containing protein [Polyangiaceae bacterium]
MKRVISLKVKPNARRSRLEEQPDGSYRAELAAPPVDGKANEELIRLVAEHFGVPRRLVTIQSGAGARLKLVAIADDGERR